MNKVMKKSSKNTSLNVQKRILLIGMMGCGKTTVGKIVAKKMKLDYVDMDKHIEKTRGLKIPEIFDISENYFRELETSACEILSKRDNIVVCSGGGIVLKEENIKYFDDFTKVYINRSCELILSTVNRKYRPLLKNGDDLFIAQYDKRLPLYNKYKDIEVISDGTPYQCAKKILKELTYCEKNNGNKWS